MRRERGQAEMIGLVLIVLFLAVGFLLYIKFAFTPDRQSAKLAHYEQTQFGTTFVTALAQTTTTCDGVKFTVEELLRDIATGRTRCSAEAALDEIVTDILNRTLDDQGVNYFLVFLRRVDKNRYEPFGLKNYTNKNYAAELRCRPEMGTIPDTYPIVLNTGNVEIRLAQCS